MKVALFDIDGTLVWTHGAGRRAMQRALVAVVGTEAEHHDHRYDGKTDRQIVREAMRMDGVADADIVVRMPDVLARYIDELTVELESGRTTASSSCPASARCSRRSRLAMTSCSAC